MDNISVILCGSLSAAFGIAYVSVKEKRNIISDALIAGGFIVIAVAVTLYFTGGD